MIFSYLCLLSTPYICRFTELHSYQIFQTFMKLPKINSHTVDKLVKNSLIFQIYGKCIFMCLRYKTICHAL